MTNEVLEDAALSRPQKRKRTTQLDIKFKDRLAEGWAFGVPESFKDALDIRKLPYVDKVKTKELREAEGRTRDATGRLITVFEMLWTRGNPPSRSFDQGDIFYRPAHIRDMQWGDALRELTQSVQVLRAQPDDDLGGGGWVEAQLSIYAAGEIVFTLTFRSSQEQFETLLKTGVPAGEITQPSSRHPSKYSCP